MTFLFVLYATTGWMIGQIGHLTVGVEKTMLEFILLGRIPATNVYLQFETLLIILVAITMAFVLRVLLYSPYPTD